MSSPETGRKPGSTGPGPRRSWHRAFLPRAGGVVLGLVFLAAGVLKALDPGTFLANLPAYGVPAVFHVPVVILLPAAEIALGLMLVAGWRLRASALGGVALLVVFAAAIGWGWSRGTLEDCICFGTSLIRSPGEALRQDLLLLAVAVMTALRASEPRFFLPRRVGDGIAAAVAVAVAAALAVALAIGVATPVEPAAAPVEEALLSHASQRLRRPVEKASRSADGGGAGRRAPPRPRPPSRLHPERGVPAAGRPPSAGPGRPAPPRPGGPCLG